MSGIAGIFSTDGIKTKISGIAPLDKILLTIAGTGGMIGVGILGGMVYANRNRDGSGLSFFQSENYQKIERAVKGIQSVYQIVEPTLRTMNPDQKEKLYWIDQLFDAFQLFWNRKEIAELFGVITGGR